MSTKRLHLEFSEETLKALQEMQLKLGLNKKQVLETALDILIWIVRKKQKGMQFFAADPITGKATELVFIGLERIEQDVS